MIRHIGFTLLLVPFMGMPLFAQSTIVFEDFEDATLTYTTSLPDNLASIGNRDYFGRIDGGSGLPADVAYGNLQGAAFYGVQDTDSTSSGNAADTITMSLFGLNITNFNNLGFEIFVAEDDATDGNEDWDVDTSFRVLAQIDGGGFVPIFAIEGASGTVGNQAALVDTDFDGVGDGAEITPTFTQFTSSILGTGSVLDVQLVFDFLDTGDEDLAIDNLRVFGTSTIPEPSAVFALVMFGVVSCSRRRR